MRATSPRATASARSDWRGSGKTSRVSTTRCEAVADIGFSMAQAPAVHIAMDSETAKTRARTGWGDMTLLDRHDRRGRRTPLLPRSADGPILHGDDDAGEPPGPGPFEACGRAGMVQRPGLAPEDGMANTR
jgi:hypothetical protein